ncbi:MAG TPA: hypothetical protein PK335_12550 [Draconibacterium sp.]|nr:hypothetical protein [Draconibacterium sp.]
MRLKQIIFLATALAFLASCSTSKLITTSKTNAVNFENSGNFSEAMNAWSQYFMQTPVEQTAGEDFAHAAEVAFKAGNNMQAIAWFDQARYKNYADQAMYQTLSKIYKSEDNLSKELSSLETYIEMFGKDNAEVNERLFALYSEIGDNEKALGYWNLMNDQGRSDKANLVDYLLVNKALEKDVVCDSTATALLKIDPEQTVALDWLAKKYYWAGQNRYTSEMQNYEQNKTRKQYNILLKELDKVTADFKKALPYLEKLWKQNPSKEYASYFANIYARFGDEQKTEYYKQKMK